MPTNPVGKGTVNVAVNLLDAERDILGQLSMADDRSLSDYLRRLAIVGLRSTNPSAARQMEDARSRHQESKVANSVKNLSAVHKTKHKPQKRIC